MISYLLSTTRAVRKTRCTTLWNIIIYFVTLLQFYYTITFIFDTLRIENKFQNL